MNERLWKAIERWEETKDAEAKEATGHLLIVLQNALEHAADTDPIELDQVRLLLEYGMEDEKPADLKSYNLGMARTIVNFLQHHIFEKQKEISVMALPQLERDVLMAIGATPDITPKQIADRLRIENRQQVSNLLRSLRMKQFVRYIEAGKYHLYRLTRSGQQQYERLKAAEEPSASIAPALDQARRSAKRAEAKSAMQEAAMTVIFPYVAHSKEQAKSSNKAPFERDIFHNVVAFMQGMHGSVEVGRLGASAKTAEVSRRKPGSQTYIMPLIDEVVLQ
ncbi:helix-turn-helix domain-containing protein [Paenibacillus sp.]|uniref:MarR family transcriptional regulator n=1 Tax=Paenibacillus sp. TaxID=58172 RepID=UPI0028127D74|nr:helix-turn-helix domain-containing protein [Paenibacillus sp.]